MKIHSSGNSVEYSTYLGGEGEDGARGIAIDNTGNSYIVGRTNSLDFPVQNAYNGTLGGTDAFLTKLNTT